MGFLMKQHGRISVESRIDSFLIHPDDEQPAYGYYARLPHPEFYLEDLDDLIEALTELRDHRAAK